MGERRAGGDFVLPVGTVTLLLSDVESSTRGWEDRTEEMAEAFEHLDALAGDAVGRHDGVMPVEQGEGDSFVAAFSRASDAVACAAAIQAGLTAGSSLRLRIGLHTGEVQLRDEGNYVGRTINRTARLRDIAHGGQTVLSAATRDLVLDNLPDGASLLDHGQHLLKDLARPEHVYELVLPGVRSEFPELRSLSNAEHNLPAQLSSFVGRGRELDEAAERLFATRLLTLIGPGGCGKTRLALQVAAEALHGFEHGVRFCPLAQVRDGERVMGAVADAIGVREHGSTAIDALVERSIAERQLLLVLDNCEQVVDEVARVADRLLRNCGRLTVLATSREPIAVEGEAIYAVPPLTLPDERVRHAVDAVSTSEAVELFTDRARSVRPNFDLDDTTAPIVVDICRHLDAIPLAIELAAARTRVMPVEKIREGLEDRFRMLGRGPRTAVPRQQTLLGSVAWSHDLLTGDERAVLRRAAIFAGPFGLDGAEAVCSGGTIEPFQVLDLITTLADRSMLAITEGPLPYRMLETIRQFAHERLVEAGEHDDAVARHIDFHATRAQAARSYDEAGRLSFRNELKIGYEDVRTALVRATSSSNPRAGLAIVDPLLGTIFSFEGKVTEGRQLIADLLAGVPDASPADLIWANLNHGVLSIMAGDWMSGAQGTIQALAGSRQAGDLEAEAISLSVVAAGQALVGDPVAAAADAERAVVIAREVCDEFGTAAVLAGCAQTFMFAGRARDAEVAARECLALFEKWELPRFAALRNLGRALLLTGQLGEAAEALDAAASEAMEALDQFAAAECLLELAVIARWSGRYSDSLAERIRESMEHAAVDHDDFCLTFLGTATAWLAWVDGDHESMVATGEAASQASRAVPGLASGEHHHSTISLAHLALGDLERARANALEIGSRPNIREDRLLLRGLLFAADDDVEEAERALFEILAGDGDRSAPWCLEVVETLGCVWARGDRGPDGMRLIGAATAHRTTTNRRRVPYLVGIVSEATAAARSTLGDEAADAALADGAGLSLDEAIELATLGRGPRKRPVEGWASITPAERRVVDLAAEGLSNPEIADRLFISRRTVSTHLSRVYAKLGISSRTELAAAVARQDARR